MGEVISEAKIEIYIDRDPIFQTSNKIYMAMLVKLQRNRFEIILYLCRSGRENFYNHTKLTFAGKSDTIGREYVCQVMNELDKNHGVDAAPIDTIGDGRMYTPPANNLCPVASFKLCQQTESGVCCILAAAIERIRMVL